MVDFYNFLSGRFLVISTYNMMGRERQSMDYSLIKICPFCHKNVKFFNLLKESCRNCGNILSMAKCCNSLVIRCKSCKEVLHMETKREDNLRSSNINDQSEEKRFSFFNFIKFDVRVIVIIIISIVVFPLFKYLSLEDVEIVNENLFRKLREEFPSQSNETWYHFVSVLEKSNPAVKSITFLHGEDRRTLDCLINKLVLLYSENKHLKRAEITFSATGFEGKDYGFALEYYHSVVRKFRIFITDLTTVSGNIARMFHSLCDEVSSDIKPSLFIFTVKCDNIQQKLKPIVGASTVLQKIWSDLPDNEIAPLLSRIVKNVVHIIPEKHSSC